MNRDVSLEEIDAARVKVFEYAALGAGFLYVRELDDGRVIYLAPAELAFGLVALGIVRLGIAHNGAIKAYYAYWDYPFADGLKGDVAWSAAIGWDGDGEPRAGWIERSPIGPARRRAS